MRTPSATACMEAVMSFRLSPFPMRSPTVRLRLRSPAPPHRADQPSGLRPEMLKSHGVGQHEAASFCRAPVVSQGLSGRDVAGEDAAIDTPARGSSPGQRAAVAQEDALQGGEDRGASTQQANPLFPTGGGMGGGAQVQVSTRSPMPARPDIVSGLAPLATACAATSTANFLPAVRQPAPHETQRGGRFWGGGGGGGGGGKHQAGHLGKAAGDEGGAAVVAEAQAIADAARDGQYVFQRSPHLHTCPPPQLHPQRPIPARWQARGCPSTQQAVGQLPPSIPKTSGRAGMA